MSKVILDEDQYCDDAENEAYWAGFEDGKTEKRLGVFLWILITATVIVVAAAIFNFYKQTSP